MQDRERQLRFILDQQAERARPFFWALERQEVVLLGSDQGGQPGDLARRVLAGGAVDEVQPGRLIEHQEGVERFQSQRSAFSLVDRPGQHALQCRFIALAQIRIQGPTRGVEGQVGLTEGRGQSGLGGRNTFVVVDSTGGFADDLGIGVRKELGELGGFFPSKGQGREDGLGSGLGLGEGEQFFGGLGPGETADEAMTQPRQAEVGLGVS